MIPEAVMRELRYIEVYTAKRIRSLRVGAYTSPRRGDGFDFDEHSPTAMETTCGGSTGT